jgi:hypothetical protein
VVSWLALREARAEEFLALLDGHQLFISFVTLAEVRTLLAMNLLEPDFHRLLEKSLVNYALLPTRGRAADHRMGLASAGDSHYHQGRRTRATSDDTWIAASAFSAEQPLPIATGNLRDSQPLADASELKLIHPDL